MADRRTSGAYAKSIRVLMALAGVTLVLLVLHVCLEALFRVVLPSVTLHTLVLVATWYMVAITFLPMPFVGEVHGHMSVSLIDSLLSPRGKQVLGIFVSLLSLAYLSLLGYLTLLDAIEQTRQGSIIQSAMTYLPVWPPFWVLPLAFFLMVVGYARTMYRCAAALAGAKR